MLKNATEMARASLIAKEMAEKNEREKNEAEARSARLKLESELLLKAFEDAAMTASKLGELSMLFPGHQISLEWLHSIGFVAKRLTRRTEFEEHLESLCGRKLSELARKCDLILVKCPGLEGLDGDALLHRNPLVSLFETLWRRQELQETANVELLLAYIRTLSGISPYDLEQVREHLGDALECFQDLKRTESKYQTRRLENLTIPSGHNEVTFVSWEASEDGAGLVADFSAQKLKWLATQWPQVTELLSEWINGESAEGRFEFLSYVYFNGQKWQLDSGCESDSAIDFCNPSLATEELTALGYRVELEEISEEEAQDTEFLSEAKVRAPGNEHGVFRFLISWDTGI